MRRVGSIILIVIGLIFMGAAFLYYNGLGGTGHYRADASFVAGLILLLIGLVVLLRRPAAA